MPIEIKELNIKINVNDKPQTSDPEKKGKDDKDSIIAACVEQVMEILSKNTER
jgi:hypothetical protein